MLYFLKDQKNHLITTFYASSSTSSTATPVCFSRVSLNCLFSEKKAHHELNYSFSLFITYKLPNIRELLFKWPFFLFSLFSQLCRSIHHLVNMLMIWFFEEWKNWTNRQEKTNFSSYSLSTFLFWQNDFISSLSSHFIFNKISYHWTLL